MIQKVLKVVLLLALTGALGAAALPRSYARALAGSADDLIAEVNALRASLGAAPLQASAALNAAAQEHADYMASLGYLTHTGPGNSRPLDRAIAAGFGDGATIYVAENIAAGRDLSPRQAVSAVWSDEEQRNNLTNALYTHAGAGVSVVDGIVFYVLEVGSIAGQPAPVTAQPGASTGTPTGTAAGTEGPGSAPTSSPTPPFQTGTPQPDGSILYEVRPGDSLWGIATAHGIQIEQIQQWNGMGNSDIVQAGSSLIVAPTYTPTLVPTETVTLAPPTRTPRPTSTPRPPTFTPAATAVPPTLTATSRPILPALAPGSSARRTLGLGMVVICVLGVIVILLGGLKKR